MKKTIIALMALAGVTAAETLTLDSYAVSYGTGTTLSTGNQLMTWSDSQTYSNWYMEFSFTELTDNNATIGSRWVSTICSDSSTVRKGLSASVQLLSTDRTPNITFGDGGETSNLMGSSPTLIFTAGDALTMAVYDNIAYIGNKSTETYISLDLDTVTLKTGSDSTMSSGAARAFANSNSTKIGETTIASLDSLTIPNGQALDIVKLVTTGAAETMSVVPEPTTATLSLLALAGLAVRRRRK